MKTLLTLMALMVFVASAQAQSGYYGGYYSRPGLSTTTITPIGQGHYRIHGTDTYGRGYTETVIDRGYEEPAPVYTAPTIHNDLMNQMLIDYLTE